MFSESITVSTLIYMTFHIRLVNEQNMFHSWEIFFKCFGTVI